MTAKIQIAIIIWTLFLIFLVFNDKFFWGAIVAIVGVSLSLVHAFRCKNL